MHWDLVLTKGFSIAIVLGFFALIVFFLRFLYGPKGKFRDPLWDKWNEEARLELEKEVDGRADKRLKAAFLEYTDRYRSGNAEEDGPIELKVEHSLRVLAFAEEIAAAEPVFDDHNTGRALRLAALFHDIGRFEQYKKYKSFTDSLTCNHGALGAKVLRREGFLRNEAPEMQRMVLSAVAVHNKLQEPRGYRGRQLAILGGLKDADKLDIMRVLSEKLAPGAKRDEVALLHLKFEDGSYSPSILRALEEDKVALYNDMRYVNDFRILLCTWLPDLHYSASRRIIKREGHLDAILEGLANIPDVCAKARGKVEQYLAAV